MQDVGTAVRLQPLLVGQPVSADVLYLPFQRDFRAVVIARRASENLTRGLAPVPVDSGGFAPVQQARPPFLQPLRPDHFEAFGRLPSPLCAFMIF